MKASLSHSVTVTYKYCKIQDPFSNNCSDMRHEPCNRQHQWLPSKLGQQWAFYHETFPAKPPHTAETISNFVCFQKPV